VAAFSFSYDFPAHPDHEFFTRAASPFQTAASGQKIEITSFTFFNNIQASGGFLAWSNAYDVYMTTGGGSRAFFGHFNPANPLCSGAFSCPPMCDPTVSPTCLPNGSGARGEYLYDPSLGDLGIEMIETVDIAVTGGVRNWWSDAYASGGGGLVT